MDTKISILTRKSQKKVAIRIFKKYKSYKKSQVNTLQMHTHLLKQIYHENWVTSLFITQSCQMKCPQDILKFSCELP